MGGGFESRKQLLRGCGLFSTVGTNDANCAYKSKAATGYGH